MIVCEKFELRVLAVYHDWNADKHAVEEFNLGDTTKPNEIVKLVWSGLGIGSYGRFQTILPLLLYQTSDLFHKADVFCVFYFHLAN